MDSHRTFSRQRAVTLFVSLVCGSILMCSCTSPAVDTPPEADTPDATADDAASHEGQVLRHAVFFSFKAESSEADVQAVVDAFRGLPAKIEEITEFQSGVNNSPEELDDGFTHCFLLTFADAAGRSTYIPHQAHAGDFADVLRPHMDKVFVIDYWGEPYETMEKELKHAVFFKFNDDASAEEVKTVEDAFAALPSKIDAIKHFEWGRNNSPEKNDHGFTHCFMVTFDSEEGRAAYLPHPDHKAFVEVLKPVLDKARVLDFWANGQSRQCRNNCLNCFLRPQPGWQQLGQYWATPEFLRIRRRQDATTTIDGSAGRD